jgi:hypothetical protein
MRDSAAPKRAKARSDSEEPKLAYSKTAKDADMRAKLRNANELPNVANSKTDNEAPNRE